MGLKSLKPHPRKDALLGTALARKRRWRGIPVWAVETLVTWPDEVETRVHDLLNALIEEAERRSSGRSRQQVVRDMRPERLASLMRDVSFSVVRTEGGTGVWVKNHVAPSETHESA
jgi:molybdopterin biosynthesis enzyme MoaB